MHTSEPRAFHLQVKSLSVQKFAHFLWFTKCVCLFISTNMFHNSFLKIRHTDLSFKLHIVVIDQRECVLEARVRLSRCSSATPTAPSSATTEAMTAPRFAHALLMPQVVHCCSFIIIVRCLHTSILFFFFFLLRFEMIWLDGLTSHPPLFLLSNLF